MTGEERSRAAGGRTALVALLLGPFLFVGLLWFGEFDPQRPAVGRTAAVAALMALYWITEAIPLPATALLPVVLFPLLGVMNGRDVAATYFNHIVFLFIGGFVVALAMERVQLHRRIALRILLLFGGRPARIVLGFMVASAFLSMWISNTAAAMMMVTIALAIILELEQGREPAAPGAPPARRLEDGTPAALLIGVAYGSTIGGLATLVGTPPNMSLVRIFEISFPGAPPITFAGWFLFAFPLAALLLALAFGVLVLLHPARDGVALPRETLRQQLRALGPMGFAERAVAVLFALLVLLWMTRAEIDCGRFTIPGWAALFPEPGYINDGTVAILVALLLFVLPSRQRPGERIMDWKAAARLPWGVVLLFGGGFALATGFTESGLSDWLGSQLEGAAPSSPVLLLGLLCTAITFLTELTSNTATTEMILPVLAGLARQLETHPLFLMVPVTLSCSCAFMLPVATPPNAIVFGTERLRIGQMVRAGVILNLLGAALIVLWMMLAGTRLFGIDLEAPPAWLRGS